MINTLYSVGDRSLRVIYTDITSFFLSSDLDEAKERFHKFLKAYIEDHPLSTVYKDFVLYDFGLISNTFNDYLNESDDKYKFCPEPVATYQDFPDLEDYRAQVLRFYRNSIDPDFIRSLVDEQLSVINKLRED